MLVVKATQVSRDSGKHTILEVTWALESPLALGLSILSLDTYNSERCGWLNISLSPGILQSRHMPWSVLSNIVCSGHQERILTDTTQIGYQIISLLPRVLTRKISQRGGKTSSPCPLYPPPPPSTIRWKFDRYAEPHLPVCWTPYGHPPLLAPCIIVLTILCYSSMLLLYI